MAKIQITEGRWNADCTTELNLTNAQATDPNKGYDKVIMYAEKRYLMTFLTAGATNGEFTVARADKQYKTRVPMVPTGELIDGKAWKYHIMGRIQKATEILGSAVIGIPTAGTSSYGGFFTIPLKDGYLQPDMNAIFYNGKMARVMKRQRNTDGTYNYTFQTFPGDTFSWAVWIAPQIGAKTLFGGYTTHGERSLKGYGRTHYPDSYINHMTIQRKGEAITGDANAERVLWYANGKSKGWMYWIESQARAQFLMEDEFQKWHGKSTMKDSDGNLLASPSMTDPVTGMPIIAGDGWIEQIKGSNDVEASGSDGLPIYDDFRDIISAVKKRSNNVGGELFYCVTGIDGMNHAHDLIAAHGLNVYRITQEIKQTNAIGGASPAIGFNFQTLNVGGSQIVFVHNTLQDDEMKFPRKLSNGKLAEGCTYYIMNASPDATGKPNIEIRTRGREGVNRNMVYYYINGMTGDGKPQMSTDGKEFQMLKENMIVTYNTKSNGIIAPASTA